MNSIIKLFFKVSVILEPTKVKVKFAVKVFPHFV
jgi:hypothetical protein